MEKLRQNKNGLMILGAIVILVIIFLITKNPNNSSDEILPVNDEVLSEEDLGEVEGQSTASAEIPMPAESSWVSKNLNEKISFSVPEGYFVSYPNIDDCDTASISTNHNGDTVSVAFIYNSDCGALNGDTNYSKMVEKNGFTFRTNYSGEDVIAVFDKIVESAK